MSPRRRRWRYAPSALGKAIGIGSGRPLGGETRRVAVSFQVGGPVGGIGTLAFTRRRVSGG